MKKSWWISGWIELKKGFHFVEKANESRLVFRSTVLNVRSAVPDVRSAVLNVRSAVPNGDMILLQELLHTYVAAYPTHVYRKIEA